jgi:hypothetical protein
MRFFKPAAPKSHPPQKSPPVAFARSDSVKIAAIPDF